MFRRNKLRLVRGDRIMARTVKFRGKRLDNGEWVYGGYYKHLTRTPYPIGDRIKESDYKHLIFNSGFSDWNMPKSLECIEVDGDTIGQYTGLKDKNGKKMYEGDIIPTLKEITVGLENREIITEVNYIVVFDSIEYDFKLTNGKEEYRNNFEYLCCVDKPEVIGNIYDNPNIKISGR